MRRAVFGISILLSLAALVVLGFQTAKSSDGNVVRASRVEVVNQSGTTVLILEADAAGSGRIVVLDRNQTQIGVVPISGAPVRLQSGSSTSGGSSAEGGRCQATTKKGTQCLRRAKAGSSYCWQHQR